MIDSLVRIFYIGTNYHGSQWQPGIRTIHGELLNALSQWQGAPVPFDAARFSGRTDKGVHSFGQLVLIKSDSPLDIDRVNNYLPPDIILWGVCRAPKGFRPRFDTLMRHYRYFFVQNSKFNLDAMRLALQYLIGTHNFSQLSKPDGTRPTMTTILNASLINQNDILYLDIIGTNFLWKLVRKVVTLISQIGLGMHTPSIIHDILEYNISIHGGIEPAPPEGLFLIESIVPFTFMTSKYAIRRIRSLMNDKTEFLKRQLASFTSLTKTTTDLL